MVKSIFLTCSLACGTLTLGYFFGRIRVLVLNTQVLSIGFAYQAASKILHKDLDEVNLLGLSGILWKFSPQDIKSRLDKGEARAKGEAVKW